MIRAVMCMRCSKGLVDLCCVAGAGPSASFIWLGSETEIDIGLWPEKIESDFAHEGASCTFYCMQ